MQYPIVYINKLISVHNYLNYFPQILSITQKFTRAPIVYISNDSYNSTAISKKYEISFNTSEINMLQTAYEHMSSNSLSGELACFERWFLLKEYMIQNKIEKCVYLDSDAVILDPNYTCVFDTNFDISASRGHSLHCAFINNIDFIIGFTEYILDFYINKNQDFLECKSIYETNYKNQNNGGIVDMYLFYMYSKTQKHKILELSTIRTDEFSNEPYVYDHNILDVEGFEARTLPNEIIVKDLFFDKNKVFATNINGSPIRMRSLHFQGVAKNILCNHQNTYTHNLLS